MTLERFWQTVIVNCEALTREVLPASAEAAGKPISGTFVVVDLAGFGYVPPTANGGAVIAGLTRVRL